MSTELRTPVADDVVNLVQRSTGRTGIDADNVLNLGNVFGRQVGRDYTTPGIFAKYEQNM